MLSKSKLKTWLRKKDFKPDKINWQESLKYQVFCKNNRYFRFRVKHNRDTTNVKEWVVDVSCFKEEFDRWANSQEEHSVPLETFILRY